MSFSTPPTYMPTAREAGGGAAMLARGPRGGGLGILVLIYEDMNLAISPWQRGVVRTVTEHRRNNDACRQRTPCSTHKLRWTQWKCGIQLRSRFVSLNLAAFFESLLWIQEEKLLHSWTRPCETGATPSMRRVPSQSLEKRGVRKQENGRNKMTLSWALGTCYIDREKPLVWCIQHHVTID
jgi:hypothetical protein